jgi:hypothetical protein
MKVVINIKKYSTIIISIISKNYSNNNYCNNIDNMDNSY